MLLLLLPLLPTLSFADFMIGNEKFAHSWSTKTKLPAKRSDLSATTYASEIYLAGGCSGQQNWIESISTYSCSIVSDRFEKYNPSTDTYTTLSSLPKKRYRHVAFAISDKLYLVGGSDQNDAIVQDIDVYDLKLKTWSTLAEKAPFSLSDSAAFVSSNKAYIIGGYDRPNYNAKKTTHIFDPTKTGTNAWSVGPELKQSRGDTVGVAVNGKGYVIGGFHHENSFNAPIASVESLDTGKTPLAWSEVSNMKVSRGDKAGAVSLHGYIHVVGGESKNTSGHSLALADVEVYSPTSNQWYAGGNLPTKRFRFTAAVVGESFYIFGGQGSLVGESSKAGSYYPVLDLVEVYTETRTVLDISTSSSIAMCSFVTFVVLAMSTFQLF
eukprot:g1733.t1